MKNKDFKKIFNELSDDFEIEFAIRKSNLEYFDVIPTREIKGDCEVEIFINKEKNKIEINIDE